MKRKKRNPDGSRFIGALHYRRRDGDRGHLDRRISPNSLRTLGAPSNDSHTKSIPSDHLVAVCDPLHPGHHSDASVGMAAYSTLEEVAGYYVPYHDLHCE